MDPLSALDDALLLSERGWSVFPGMLTPDNKKVPIGELVEHGFKDATTHRRRIGMWWRIKPEANIGVAMPPDTVALDVDDVGVFERLGLELIDGPGQQTPSGGYHRFFRTDGRHVKQSVKTEFPGADTRVGGKGYVFAWQPEAFPSVDDLPFAPEWMYGGSFDDDEDEPYDGGPSIAMDALETGELYVAAGGRDNSLASLAGSLAARGAPTAAVELALNLIIAAGGIEQSLDDPITKTDVHRIARSVTQTEAAKRRKDAVAKSPVERHYATDLLEKDLPPLEYLVAEILPEGLGVVAGAPKVGKSWLTFQAALELSVGGSLLGRPVDEPRPVLYYGLEDGERRFQKRLMDLIGRRPLDIRLLELRYEAPAITEGLEEDIRFWIDQNPQGAVFIDVLAKVRPQSKGKGNAYDEDYTVMGPLQTISKERPGSAIVVVTHDRKAGSEDFLTTVTGTRGITGAADWVWVIKRERLAIKGTIFVTGRDIERDSAIEANFTGNWTALPSHAHAKSYDQERVLDALRTMPDGEGTAQEIAKVINPSYVPAADATLDAERQSASDKANSLVDQGIVRKAGRRPGRNGGLIFHYISEDERKEIIDTVKRQAREAQEAQGMTSIPVHRVPHVVTVVTPRGRGTNAPGLEGVTRNPEVVTDGVTPSSTGHISRNGSRVRPQEGTEGSHAYARDRARETLTGHNRHTVIPSNEVVTVVESSDLTRPPARPRAPLTRTHVRLDPTDEDDE